MQNNFNPDFGNLLAPEKILNHITDLKNSHVIDHGDILNKLLEEVMPIDFKKVAFPELDELNNKLKTLDVESIEYAEVKKQISSKKISHKHLLVISIEQIIDLARLNKWSICKKHDFIYLFNGAYWQEVDKDEFQNFLAQASEKMGVEIYLVRHYDFKEKLFKQFMASAFLPEPNSVTKDVLINLLNGTFQISNDDQYIRSFNSHDFLTYQLPFEFNKEAKAPLFQQYLNTVLPEQDKQDVLAEYLGLVFIKNGNKSIKEEKALILYGTGANGKSVFFEVVSALLGENNISNFSLSSLTNDNGYYRAKIANKLLNYASEINGKLEVSIFKQLVSGEPVEARLPYGQPFTLKQYARLIFNCNELPKDVEQTNAFFRRFLIIPFDVTISEDKQDKELHNKIIESELSGVFDWVLSGLNRLLTQKGFTKCDAVISAIEAYKKDSNSVLMFLEDKNYQKSVDNSHLLSALYHEYKNFCDEDGMYPFKKRNFSNQLKQIGYKSGRQGGTGQTIVYIENKIS